MDVFELHQHVVDDYAAYTKSFIRISDERISATVHQDISEGLLWPEPLLQLNPSFAPGKDTDRLRRFRDRLRYDREMYAKQQQEVARTPT